MASGLQFPTASDDLHAARSYSRATIRNRQASAPRTCGCQKLCHLMRPGNIQGSGRRGGPGAGPALALGAGNCRCPAGGACCRRKLPRTEYAARNASTSARLGGSAPTRPQVIAATIAASSTTSASSPASANSPSLMSVPGAAVGGKFDRCHRAGLGRSHDMIGAHARTLEVTAQHGPERVP